MGIIDSSDVRVLMQDEKLMSEIAKAMVEDPSSMDALVDDIVDELDDELEDNPEFKRQLLSAAMATPQFKKQVVTRVVAELEDD